MRSKFTLLLSFFFTFSLTVNAQFAPPENWFHMDKTVDGYQGVSSDKAYNEFLKDRPSVPVIVAILDSGIDVEHQDLEDNIWVNVDEIPGNGIDDDNNGYIDDVHGWNFIGGANGDVNHETYEVTRLYGKLKPKYDKIENPMSLSKDDKKEYSRYLSYKKEVEGKREAAQTALDQVNQAKEAYNLSIKAVAEHLNTETLTKEKITSVETDDELVLLGKNIMLDIYNTNDDDFNVDTLLMVINQDLDQEVNSQSTKLNYAYNPDYDSRKEIVGDNYADSKEMHYGNNNYEGPDALHGTHVGGIVGALRNNGLGGNGIAKNVQLMSVRCVPDGDERDKDVANAIRYAVDNGASIINMSFGKGHSWDKDIVDEAVKYAAKNDVLLVHAAGNGSQDNDNSENYPNDTYDKPSGWWFWKKKSCDTWIEVGALSFMPGASMVAPFSNYGQEHVDLFSPGMQIYATLPNDQYARLQGTSMASPIVAGMAAVLRSYFPTLKAKQVKEILESTTVKIDEMVTKPGTKDELVPFSSLSRTGGVVNLYNAIKKASVTKGKKKIKKSKKTAA